MRKAILTLLTFMVLFIHQISAHGDSSNDFLRSTGKIYVVIVVIAVILIVLFMFLYRLDKKINRLEKNIEK